MSAVHPAERAAPLGEQHQSRVAGQVAGLVEVDRTLVVQRVEVEGADLDLGHPGPARVGLVDQLGAVLLGVEADGRRLDPHRQVLGDQRDQVALVGEVARHREDPGVVVAEPEAGRERVGVGVVQLDPDRAAGLADRDRLVETPVADPQLVEHPQRRPREVAELGVVPLALELRDHHHREHHLVLLELAQRRGIGQQDAGVDHVGTACAGGARGARCWAGRCDHGHPLVARHAHSAPRSWLSSTDRSGWRPECLPPVLPS